jgi:hypothetical protein
MGRKPAVTRRQDGRLTLMLVKEKRRPLIATSLARSHLVLEAAAFLGSTSATAKEQLYNTADAHWTSLRIEPENRRHETLDHPRR